jgi:hypothetical protein
MRNGRFHPPKCRSKVQKIREETLLISTGHLSKLM